DLAPTHTIYLSLHDALPILGTILAKLEFLDEALAQLSAEIAQVIAPFTAEAVLLRTIPGVDRRTAEALIAEIGVDMTRFGAAGRGRMSTRLNSSHVSNAYAG